MAIVSFGDKATEDLFHHGKRSRFAKRVPSDLFEVLGRKFDQLVRVVTLDELGTPPGNRLEKLRGDLKGFYSIRVNDQYRLVFQWTDMGPAEVALLDYH